MRWLSFIVPVFFQIGCASTQVAPSVTERTVVSVSEVDWQKLNPARGDASPKAGTLWGDRSGVDATGFLFNPVDGFESPPHIHNVTYRGVVIRGLVHNDDPDAEEMWMPAGSYWVQPKGDVHITAAEGTDTLAYIEIDEGPYLVRSVEEAFDSNEKPANTDASEIVWKEGDEGVAVSVLWGDPQDLLPSGRLVRVRAGFSGALVGRGANLRAVVIAGRIDDERPNEGTLAPGSFFSSAGPMTHRLSCAEEAACVVYVRSEGGIEIVAG